jgi:hypothetical protein
MSSWTVAELAADARQGPTEAAESLALFERKGLVELSAEKRSFGGGPQEPVYVLTAKGSTAMAWSDFASPDAVASYLVDEGDCDEQQPR